MPETDEPPREKKSRAIKLSRKLTKKDSFSIFEAREKSVLGPRFQLMSPLFIFIANIATLGLRSAFWVVNRMSPLLMLAKPEEKNIKFQTTLWIMSFCSYFTLTILVAFNFAAYRPGPEYLIESHMSRAALASFAVSFLVNRYILYWSREVIIDELLENELDVIRSRAVTFAPSPLLIWFFGVSYIQAHINRMIKKNWLNAYKPSKGARVRKSPPRDRAKKIKPELASGPSQA
jgi:hypothetical protein